MKKKDIIYNYDYIEKYLNSKKCTVVFLRKLSKSFGIKKIYVLKKKDLVQKILEYFAVKKLQRFLRSYCAVSDNCIISLDPLVYPFWGKKTRIPRRYNYYNLKPLVEYIVAVGFDRAYDPATKEKFCMKDIRNINELFKKSSLWKEVGYKDMMRMLKRKTYYKHLQTKEEQIEVLIDLIREVMVYIRNEITNSNYKKNVECQIINETTIMKDFKFRFSSIDKYIDRLYKINREWSKKTFMMMLKIIESSRDYDQKRSKLKQKCLNLITTKQKKYKFLNQTHFDLHNNGHSIYTSI